MSQYALGISMRLKILRNEGSMSVNLMGIVDTDEPLEYARYVKQSCYENKLKIKCYPTKIIFS